VSGVLHGCSEEELVYVSVGETEDGGGQRLRIVSVMKRGGCVNLRIGLIEDLFGKLRCRYGWRSFEWGRVGRE